MIRDFADKSPDIANDAWIDPQATVIGDVRIGARSSLWPGVVARGDIHHIRIGSLSNIQDNSVLHVTHAGPFAPEGFALRIGDGVTVGHRVILHGCEIGDNSLIGMGAIVMDGAVVESGVMLGAGSVVPGGKRLESGYLYLGSPARKVRELRQSEIDYFGYSAEHYAQLAEAYRRTIDYDY
ncbi:MAG TPA: gamma carbonic anhydrase family protein [Chromatiaceae bacterium]|nr:gamma carbonic anhydrase family protein [Chromatiaceae bacterium]